MKKKSLFWKVYRIAVLVFSLVIIAVWGVLYSFLNTYEKNVPENIVKNIVNNLNSKDYKVFKNNIESEEFYSTEDLINIIKTNSNNEEYSYKKVAGLETENELGYKIMSGDKEVVRLILNKSDKKASFNIDKWEVKSTKLNSIKKNDIKVIVPASAEVLVNNNTVKDEYVTNNNYIREKFDAIKGQVTVPTEKVYEIKDIYEGTEIKTKYNNNEYVLTSEDNDYYFGYPSNESMLNEAKGNLNLFIDNYTRYIIAEKGFSAVTPYLIKNSNAYNFLIKIQMTNLWSGDHTRANISEVKYTNMQEYSDGLFSVDADYVYDYDVYGGAHKSFETHVTLYLMKQNNSWYIVDLTM